MKKVIIIGCPGSGKSTFARELEKVINIPLYYLDMMNWNSDRTTVSKEVFISKLMSVLSKDEWIIDGNYFSTMEMRIQACDTIFFLDYTTEVCLNGIKARKGKKRPDMPWIETEDDMEFLEFVRDFAFDVRPNIYELLNKYSYKNIFVFKDRKNAKDFLNSII